MLLDGLNKLSSLHIEQVLSRWHLVSNAHPRLVVNIAEILLLLYNHLDLLVTALELSFKLVHFVSDDFCQDFSVLSVLLW